MENTKNREGFAYFIGLHELADATPGDGGDGVPQHPEDIGKVEDREGASEGCEESSKDGTKSGNDDDCSVSPFQPSTHQRHNCNLYRKCFRSLMIGYRYL